MANKLTSNKETTQDNVGRPTASDNMDEILAANNPASEKIKLIVRENAKRHSAALIRLADR